jgi:hypothetical protein
MSDFLKRVVAERVAGGRPSAPRAMVAAAGVGIVVAGMTYRLLRQ